MRLSEKFTPPEQNTYAKSSIVCNATNADQQVASNRSQLVHTQPYHLGNAAVVQKRLVASDGAQKSEESGRQRDQRAQEQHEVSEFRVSGHAVDAQAEHDEGLEKHEHRADNDADVDWQEATEPSGGAVVD